MRIRNWKIGSWLIVGFTIILSFVVVIGLTSYNQANQLAEQTETMYNHPLVVRRSIDNIQLGTADLMLEFRNLILAEDQSAIDRATLNMQLAQLQIENEFKVLEDRYLGPIDDVNDAYEAYIVWMNQREINIELFEDGETTIVLESISENGSEALKRDDFENEIQVIDDFAQLKSDELYNNSQLLHEQMTFQLTTIVVLLFVFTVLIGLWLYTSFKRPLSLMNKTVQDFQSGDMTSRVGLRNTNELGDLAKSIDEMADVIEENEKLHLLVNDFSDKLISENNLRGFYRLVLKTLMLNTNSITASVYMRNAVNDTLDLYEGIGLNGNTPKSYSIKDFEGELGIVLATKEPHITKINPENTNFMYVSTIGGIVPKELMSIPIVINDSVNSIVVLASLEGFIEPEIEFINRVIDNLTSRTETIIATERINDFVAELEQRSKELQTQNVELEMQKRQLNEASKLKSNFLSNMSHELRTPLNSVIALSGVLYDRLKNNIPEEEYSYLEIIGRNGKNLLNLINDILDISRIESGKVEMEITSFDTIDLIKDTMSMFTVQANDKGISLDLVSKQDNVTISSDHDKLRHILQNLLSNAMKFTEKGSISIKVEDENEHIDIKVTDTGIGIAQENLKSIFEEFKQADSGTSRRYGGTGLRLSIVRNYVELLHGSISVQSKLGKGTMFTITIPKNYYDKNIPTPVLNKKDSTIYSPVMKDDLYDKRILLVEDNESVIIQMKNLVEGMGIEILVAENGEKGLKTLQYQEVDAIILDLMMPGIDGFEVLKNVRNNELTNKLPILILTAKHLTKKDLSTLKQNNVHQVIQKGDIDKVELQTAIFNMLYNIEPKYKTPKIGKGLKPKILIVEDNPDNMITLKAILKDFGEIFEATDGEQGIERAKHIRPNLILMDIALPKVSGIEAFHEIKKVEYLKSVPILAITASALESEKDKILSHGFNSFISKPVDKNILMKELERVLFDD